MPNWWIRWKSCETYSTRYPLLKFRTIMLKHQWLIYHWFNFEFFRKTNIYARFQWNGSSFWCKEQGTSRWVMHWSKHVKESEVTVARNGREIENNQLSLPTSITLDNIEENWTLPIIWTVGKHMLFLSLSTQFRLILFYVPLVVKIHHYRLNW